MSETIRRESGVFDWGGVIPENFPFDLEFDRESRRLSVSIKGITRAFDVENGMFNPLLLANADCGFPEIEHPIRDDLGRRESVIRAKLRVVFGDDINVGLML